MADSDWEIEESPQKATRQSVHWGDDAVPTSDPASRHTSPASALGADAAYPLRQASPAGALGADDSDWEVESNASPPAPEVPPEEPFAQLVPAPMRDLGTMDRAASPSLDAVLERSGDSWQIEREGGSDPLAESLGSWAIESPRHGSPAAVRHPEPALIVLPEPTELLPPPVPAARKGRHQPRGAAAVAASAAAIPARALRPGGLTKLWPPPLELRTFVGQDDVKRPKSKEMLGFCVQLQEGDGPLAEHLRRLALEQARDSRRWHKHTPLSLRAVSSDAAFWNVLLESLSIQVQAQRGGGGAAA